MQVVPLAAEASQTLSIALNGQAVEIAIYTLGMPGSLGLFVDLQSNGVPIVNCRAARAYSGSSTEAPPFLLLDALYQGFQGDFLFVDTQGDADPEYSGLGTRWQLVYYTPADLVAAGSPFAVIA